MRIAHIVYTPRLSGAEVLVSLLIPKHIENGHAAGIVSLNPSEVSFSRLHGRLLANNTEMFFPATKLSRSERIAFLESAFSSFKPDVIFAHSVIPSAYSRWVARRLKVPVVTVLHDASRDDYRALELRLAERFFLPRPQYVVAVAECALINYQKRISDKIQGSVIENAIDLNELREAKKNRAQYRKEVLGFANDELLFVSVGRYSRQKNQEFLIEAFAQIPLSARDKCRLLLLGISEDKTYEKHLRDIAIRLGDRVHFLADRADSLAILACADIYCMPSLNEGFSLAFLEGLAMEIEVVASNIPAFRFAQDWPGVSLLPLHDVSVWSDWLASQVDKPQQLHARSLEKFEPSAVARKYELIATRVVQGQLGSWDTTATR